MSSIKRLFSRAVCSLLICILAFSGLHANAVPAETAHPAEAWADNAGKLPLLETALGGNALPEQTKALLQKNGNIRQSFKEHYIRFKSKLSYSKALGEYDELEASTKTTLDKSEQVLEEFVKGVDVGKRTFTQHEIDAYVAKATHTNPKGYKQVMLGKYDNNAETSYIKRAGNDYTYFDLGEEGWDEALNIVQSDDEMWRINKEFLKQQKDMGSEFYFSHNPYDDKVRTGFTRREIEYLTTSIDNGGLGGHIDKKPTENNLWKVHF